MAKDTQINLRIDSKHLSELKKRAKIEKSTPSKLLSKMLDEIITGQALLKDQKIQVLESRIKELESRLEKEFGKKIPRKKRISVALSDLEYLKISEISSKNRVSNSHVIRQMLERGSNLKALK